MVIVEARLLHRDPAGAALPQHAREQGQPVPEAAADEDQVGVGDHAAHAREVVGERRPQLGPAARVAVAEACRRRRTQAPAQGAHPGRVRKGREVGKAGVEAEARAARRGRRRPWPRCRRRGDSADPRAAAAPGRQVALGLQLRVGLGDRAASEAEVRGERARGGEARAGAQAAVPDRGPQRGLDGIAAPATARDRELQRRARSGPILLM